MGINRRTSLRTIIGQAFTVICAIHAIGNIFVNVAVGNGLGMLANIIAAVSLIGLFITVQKYHDSQDMAQWPAIAMCGYLISNLFLIFAESWTYAFMILPLVAMILLLTVFPEWGVPGIVAGAMMILFNIIGGMIMFHSNALVSTASTLSGGRISSMYFASLLVNNNSLMGIACICFFCEFPSTSATGKFNNKDFSLQDANNPWQ